MTDCAGRVCPVATTSVNKSAIKGHVDPAPGVGLEYALVVKQVLTIS